MIRNASELTPAEKSALATLLGRRVQDSEAISLRAFERSNLSDQQRLSIANELRSYFAEIDATRHQPSPGEAHQRQRPDDDAMAETMRSVRPGYRSHQ